MSRLSIQSAQNPRVKSVARLNDRKTRRESGLMLVEGFHELTLAWKAGIAIETLFFCPELVRPGESGLLTEIESKGHEVIEVNRSVLEKMCYRENPDAWLCVAETPSRKLAGFSAGANPLIILCENLEKPGNLGAILRSADAVGAAAVLVCEGRTDVFNPNVVRASKGSLFSVPVIECSNEEALAWLESQKIIVLAATPEASMTHWDADLSGPVAIAVGAEKEGLSAFWMEKSSAKVIIPMLGTVNSLNVAQAATLLAYEALRQRTAFRACPAPR